MPSSHLLPAVRAWQAQEPTPSPLERLATLVRCESGQLRYRSGDSVECWYRIVSGAARKCALTATGSRRIVDFLMPPDFFGFGTQGHHRFGIEVIAGGTLIARYPRRCAERLADSDPLIGRQIREAAFSSINRLQARLVMLGHSHALQRLGAFLLELQERSEHRSSGEITLPMSRYDIADYLAMAVETVSRGLTQLRLAGAIRFDGVHEVCICDPEALRVTNRPRSSLPRARRDCIPGAP